MIVAFCGKVSTGATFTSLMITLKLLVALRLGEPLSDTFTMTFMVLGPRASLGVQLNAPPGVIANSAAA